MGQDQAARGDRTRRQALQRIGGVALGAYVAPALTVLSTAEAQSRNSPASAASRNSRASRGGGGNRGGGNQGGGGGNRGGGRTSRPSAPSRASAPSRVSRVSRATRPSPVSAPSRRSGPSRPRGNQGGGGGQSAGQRGGRWSSPSLPSRITAGGRELRVRPDGTVESQVPRWLANILGNN